jgi:hypothetical protein
VLDVQPPSGPNAAAAPGATLMTDDPLQIALPDDIEQFCSSASVSAPQMH